MNISLNLRKTTALVFALVAGAGLAAQEMGSISGVIRDDASRPVSGVVVTVTAPTMLGVRNTTTNDQGRYSIPLLPVGDYRISISKAGYLGQRAENIRVGIGASVSHNFTIRTVGVAATTVEITGGTEVGMVDKAETGAKFNFSAQQLSMLPVSRTFSGAANLSPGVVTGQSGQFNIRGGQAQQTQYRVNGADIKDDYQGVVTGYGAIADNIEDTQLVLSETHARYGRSLGGSINVTTKSGSNTFSGSFRSDFGRDSWRGTTPRNLYQGNVFSDDLQRDHTYTFNGPLWKDRIWFALSGVLSPTSSNVYTLGNILGGANTVLQWADNSYNNMQAMSGNAPTDPNAPINVILNQGPPGYAWSRFDRYENYTRTRKNGRQEYKLTAMPIQNHTIDAAYTREVDSILNRASSGDPASATQIARLGQLGDQNSVRQVYTYGYKGVISNNVFIEAKYTKFDNVVQWPQPKENFSRNNEVFWVLGGTVGGTVLAKDNVIISKNGNLPATRSNRSGNFNIKWMTDFFNTDHEFDAGVDYYEGRLWESSSDSAGFVVQIGGHYEASNPNVPLNEKYLFPALNFVAFGRNGQSATGTSGPSPWMRVFYGEEGMLKSPTMSYYINDSFIINEHWNGMIGLRFEGSKMLDGLDRELGSSTFFSPRLQLRYDLNGDNAHLFTFTAARYGTDFNVRFMDSIAPKAGDMNISYNWTANPYAPGDPNDPTGQLGVRFITYAQATDPNNYGFVNAFGNTGLTRRVASDLNTPFMDEFTLSYRRQLKNGSSMSITYANRSWHNDWARYTEWLPDFIVTIPDPSGKGLPNQYGQITKIFSAGEDLKRDYQSLEMEFVARVNAYFTLQGNWTISRLTGNDESSDSDATFAGYTTSKPYYHNYTVLSSAPYNATREQLSPYGPLINDVPQRGRLFATLQLPLGKGYISLGWGLTYEAGYPSSTTADWALDLPDIPKPDGSAGRMTTPAKPSYYTTYWNGRGWRRSNDNFNNNLRMSFAVPLGLKGWGKSVQMIGDLDVTNVFNARIYAEGYYSSYVSPDNGYLRFANYGSYRFGTANPAIANYWRSTRSVGASLGLKF